MSVATNQLINDISIAHEHINDIDYNSANGNIYATVSGHTTAGSNDILFVISGLSQEVISSILIPRETTTRNLNTIGIDHLYTTSRRNGRESRSEVRNGQGPTESTKEPDTQGTETKIALFIFQGSNFKGKQGMIEAAALITP